MIVLDGCRVFGLLGAVFGFLGVAAGAFGAHGLEGSVTIERLEVFHTAARYQMYHALALLGVAALEGRWRSPLLAVAGWLFVFGTIVFSGSLFVLVLSDAGWPGAITPFGGMALLAGWGALAAAAVRSGP